MAKVDQAKLNMAEIIMVKLNQEKIIMAKQKYTTIKIYIASF